MAMLPKILCLEEYSMYKGVEDHVTFFATFI
jgi:hypothetical protein